MFDSRVIDPPLTPQRSRLILITHFATRIISSMLAVLGVLGTGSEEIIHKGRIYKA